VSVGAYAVGLAALAATVLPLVVAARAVRERYAPSFTGASAVLVDAVLVLAALTLLAELLGAVGALERAPLVVACLLTGGGTVHAIRRTQAASPARDLLRPESPTDRVLGGAALAAALLVLGQWGVAAMASLEQGMLMPDTLYYHLPFAAWFAQDGSLTEVHHVGVDHLTTPTFYPAGAELLHAVGMVLFDRDVLSPLLNVGFVALALLAGWCIGQSRGAGPLGLVAAAVAVSFPILWRINAGQAGNDAPGVALILSSAALVAVGQARGAAIPLAGLAAGLALGVKLTLVAPVLALSVAVVVLAPRGERLRRALIWGAPLVAVGGFWWVRNLVQAGSPLPWVDIDIGPLDYVAPARPQSEGLEFSVFDYATNLSVWVDYFIPDLESSMGLAWPAMIALGGAGVVSAIASRVPWQRALGIVAAFSVVAYLLTPNGAPGPEGAPWGFGLNLRFAAPALALGLVLLPLAPWLQTRRWRRLLLAVLLVVLAFNLFARLGVASGRRLDALAIAASLAALAGAVVLLRRRGRAVALAAAGCIALALAAGGWFVQRDYLRDRYAAPAPNLTPAGVWARDVRDARIGVLGFVPQYPLFGLHLSNRVEAAARKSAQGGIVRYRSCPEWRRAVNRRGYRFLVLAPIPSPNPGYPPPERTLPEATWTGSDLAASELVRDGRNRVFRIEGRMNAAFCEP
jgi:hypothetical protein